MNKTFNKSVNESSESLDIIDSHTLKNLIDKKENITIIDVNDILAFSDMLDNPDLMNDCHVLDMLEDGEVNQWDLIVLVDLVMAGN